MQTLYINTKSAFKVVYVYLILENISSRVLS